MRRCQATAFLLVIFTCMVAEGHALDQSSNPATELLKSPDAATRARAARDLGKSGDSSVVPALAAAAKDPAVKVRREVVIALWLVRQPDALEPLISATSDRDPVVRTLAVDGLVGYYTGQAPEMGLGGFMRKNWERAKNRFATEDMQVDPGVKADPRVVAALEATLEDTSSSLPALEAAKGLGILTAQEAVPSLVKAAHSSDIDLAREALNALSKIKDRSAGPPLADLLDSSFKEILQDAAVTVGILRARDTLPKLQAMYENPPDRKTRGKALEGLAYLGDLVSVPLFIKALWNEEKGYRILGAEGLARAGDTKTLPEVEKSVSVENDAAARLAMQFAITALGKQDYLSAMVSELGSKLHGDRAQTYFVELSRNPQFLPRLYPYLDSRDASVRKRLCTVLMFTGDGTSVYLLERLSRDPNADVAAEALRALRAIRARVPPQAASKTGSGR